MARWVRNAAIAVGLGVALVLLAAHSRPDRMDVARTGLITAPIDVVFDQVDDFRSWQTWSPWADLDPAQVVTYEGPETGPGAAYRWAGNDDVGSGRMEVIEEDPPRRIAWRLVFTAPFQDQASTTMTLEAVEAGTRVTWRLEGDNTFTEKLADLFLGFDARIGADFERGFLRLDGVARAAAAARVVPPAAAEPAVEEPAPPAAEGSAPGSAAP